MRLKRKTNMKRLSLFMLLLPVNLTFSFYLTQDKTIDDIQVFEVQELYDLDYDFEPNSGQALFQPYFNYESHELSEETDKAISKDIENSDDDIYSGLNPDNNCNIL